MICQAIFLSLQKEASAFDKFSSLPDGETPAAYCSLCGGEVYEDDLAHLIDGYVVCPECFDDFAVEYFSPYFMTGAEIKEYMNDTLGNGG